MDEKKFYKLYKQIQILLLLQAINMLIISISLIVQ